jgi:Poxvirus A32 protein
MNQHKPQSLKLKKFDMNKIVFSSTGNSQGPVCFIIGSRGSGKSVLIIDLLYHHKDIPVGCVISPTEFANKCFSKHVPKLFIHDEYHSVLIENVLRRQAVIIKQKQREIQAYGRSQIDARVVVILDDCLYDNTWTRDVLMRKLFMNGRHWSVLLVISSQAPLGIPPQLRNNIDYTFIFRTSIFKEKKKIYENYAGIFPTFESFCSVFDQTTTGYDCMVIHNTSRSNKLEDQVFWYKADLHNDFKIGSQEFWALSKDIDSDDEETEQFDASKSRKKSGPAPIRVTKTKW